MSGQVEFLGPCLKDFRFMLKWWRMNVKHDCVLPSRMFDVFDVVSDGFFKVALVVLLNE